MAQHAEQWQRVIVSRPRKEEVRAVVIGYHGCDREVAMAVVTRRVELRSSNNDYDWLGHGIYYWEDDPPTCSRLGDSVR